MEQPIHYIDKEENFMVGQDTFVDSVADNNNATVFEDNGETGYFYAVDIKNGNKVLDALHIYNVESVIDKNKSSILKILWTEDMTKAFLSINNYFHAVFDFKKKAGYCRNAFPENQSGWTKIKDRLLTDELIDTLSKEK